MRKMREAGFRLLVVNLTGGDGLARFHSHLVGDTFRNHLICHDLPPAPAHPQLRGVSAEAVSSWRPAAQMVRHGRRLFANLGEYSGVSLRIFGDEAPKDRRPPEVTLPDVASAGQRVSRAMPQARAADRTIKKRRRQIEQLRRSQSLPVKRGTVTLGKRGDDRDAFWWFYNTTRGVYEHGFVLRGQSDDAAGLLNLIAHEAVRSGKFTVTLVTHSLTELLGALEKRANDQTWRGHEPSRRKPGLVAVVPEVGALVSDAREATALRRALQEGAGLGIAVVMGIEDLDNVVERVGGLVVDVRNQYSTLLDGAAQVGRRWRDCVLTGRQPRERSDSATTPVASSRTCGAAAHVLPGTVMWRRCAGQSSGRTRTTGWAARRSAATGRRRRRRAGRRWRSRPGAADDLRMRPPSAAAFAQWDCELTS
ncbi:hypothetical protein SAMN05216174_1309 [Actinokineospora iranica]|uniref:Uncharacterized protein n=1 Tax=Actinokineospora iranica TaxID=1271860 RepID=A0A1G6ZF45_9PSEU|nr:hypothetical protein SAMN05216174_1309 [Actinokineospora iranica]